MILEHAWALALLAAIPVLVFLHRRRAPVVVRVASVVPYRAPEGAPPPTSERRGMDPVLALVLTAAAALALGAAGPRIGSDAASVRVVVDPTASMSALLEEPHTGTVADSARAHADALIAAAAPGAVIDRGSRADDADAALAAARADGFPGVVFVTDHAPASAVPGVVVVGPSVPARANVAIVDAVLDGEFVLVTVENFGTRAAQVHFDWQDEAAETSSPAGSRADVPPQSRATIRMRAPRRGVPRIHILATVGHDALAADDEVVVERRGGARDVRLDGSSSRVAAALRALGIAARDGTSGADATVRVHGTLARTSSPTVQFAPTAGSSSGAVRAVAGPAGVDASTLVRRGATSIPLPAPSVRLAASCRLEGGDVLLEDAAGALVVRDGKQVVIALDPESATSDWTRDGSFVAMLGAALDLVTDGPERLVILERLPPGESDVARELLPEPSRDELARIVRRDSAGTDLAAACCVAGALAAALAAWFARRR